MAVLLEERTYWGDEDAARTVRRRGSCGGCSGWPIRTVGSWRLLPLKEADGGAGVRREQGARGAWSLECCSCCCCGR